MKKIILFSTFTHLLIFASSCVLGQSVGVSGQGLVPNASALLDVDATGMTPKGLLMPRIALTSITDVSTISSPANSLIVYNTGTGMVGGNGVGYYFYCSTGCTPTGWKFMASPSNGPGTSGQVLASRGSGNPPQWQSISIGGQGGKGTALGSDIYSNYMDSIGLFTPHANNCVYGEKFVTLFSGCTVGFCIDSTERVAANWTVATKTCLSVGKRLPEPREWQDACDQAGALGLNKMVDNWEWAGNFAVPLHNGITPGIATPLMGNGSCSDGYATWMSSPTPARGSASYRCVH